MSQSPDSSSKNGQNEFKDLSSVTVSSPHILQFHVAKGENPIGCFNIDEILRRVEVREIDPFDHVYDEQMLDWVPIIGHPAFAKYTDFWERLKKTFVSEVSETYEGQAGAGEWFVLKGENRYGPFAYLELVKMAQEKSLKDWDFVWNKALEKWTRLSMLPEFEPEAIKKVRIGLGETNGKTFNEVFFRRRYARAAFDGSILVHNNQKLFKGHTHELGAGGLSLSLQEGDLNVGDSVKVHIKPSKETPAFNTTCTVMSKRVLSSSDPKSPVVFGLKFIDIDSSVRSQIDLWATSQHISERVAS